ncbi:MAG TPA: ankyrin repeat domain-containing protein [Vicinamibacterales bacterium]|nr:ankyrin repeat domain-containing protein [Vicinamibacterales bacterium]
MSDALTPATSLEGLRKHAKRWLKALRAGDRDAWLRLARAWPEAPAAPTLRDVQHALGRERGAAGWTELKSALAQQISAAHTTAEDARQMAGRFLEYACPDHHVRGRPAHRIARHAAVRLLEQQPEISRHSIYTAVVCGEIDQVERLLREHPELARARSAEGGPDRSGAGGAMDFLQDLGAKAWEPLLYLCFSRLPVAAAADHATAIARALLDCGADPNAYFMAGDSRYTPLVGVIGQGEEDRPPHPRRDELTRLLLERGAEPYDMQVVYNISFRGDVLWYLRLIHEFSLKAGRTADWQDPEWHMLDMGGYGTGARWHLRLAVEHNNLELAEWCLAHGANPDAAPERDGRFPRHSLYEHALRRGQHDLAELLARYGAARTETARDPESAFVAACLRFDRPSVDRLLADHPEFRRSPKAIFAAIGRDRADIVAWLLDLGTPIEIEDERQQRPLHIAAARGAVRVAELLIARGAQIDPTESNWKNTPIDFAVYHEHIAMMDLLAAHTRDVGNLVFLGRVERLRQVLPDPMLTKHPAVSSSLFWLPEDEETAVEIAQLLLASGADPHVRDRTLRTPAEIARRRGLQRAAAILDAAAARAPADARARAELVDYYDTLAEALVTAYDSPDAAALERLRTHYERPVTHEDVRAFVWQRVYAVRQRSSQAGEPYLALDEARELIAREAGFGTWTAFVEATSNGQKAPGAPYQIDRKDNRVEPRRLLAGDEWEALFDVMRQHRITALDAHGIMTDALLERVADLEHVTALHLGGSRAVTDEGLRHLARMPQLQALDLSGCLVTDRGLEVLRHLPRLRRFQLCWRREVTDAGVAHLAGCDELESVNLMGTHTGDGAIHALAGKAQLRRFKSGREVTDAGVALLHQIPVFKTWHGGELKYSLMDAEAGPNQLMLDGPITDAGVANLAGLDGLFALSFFWHASALTPDGLAPLSALTNLGLLGCEGRLCDDTAMRHISSLPRLRMLQAQGTVATDEGFRALSASRTLEFLWGRECPNLTGRGFVALSSMPSLTGLGVSCKQVDDASLASLARFPALRELMPMDVQDDGFRYVGECRQLEHLWCMYCRDTTDAATRHIAGLSALKTYYAGKTQITDVSLTILSGLTSLERLTFWETAGISNTGVALLARLPRLQELSLEGLPEVTAGVVSAFPPQVHVSYTP